MGGVGETGEMIAEPYIPRRCGYREFPVPFAKAVLWPKGRHVILPLLSRVIAVSQPNGHDAQRFPWYLRLALAVVGMGLLVLLGTARYLEPSPNGFGTHQQLGLNQCGLRQLYGIRCPSCGMTTSWAHLTRGHVVRSLKCNSGGTLLGICALIVGPWSLASGVLGRWLVRPPHPFVIAAVAALVWVVTLIDWGIRLSL